MRCSDITPGSGQQCQLQIFFLRYLLFHYDNNFGAAAKRQWTWRSNTASGDVSRYIVLFMYIIIITIIFFIIIVTFQCRKKSSRSIFSNVMKITILWKWARLPQFLRFVSPCIIVQFKSISNQTQQFSSLLSWRLFTAQHVSGVLPPISRSSWLQ